MSFRSATLFALVCICLAAAVALSVDVLSFLHVVESVAVVRSLSYLGTAVFYAGLIVFFASLYRSQAASGPTQ